MTTTINADTSTGGAVISGDASGVLGLQAAGSTQVPINGSGVVLANPLPVGSGGTGATSLSGITAGSATNLAGGSAGTIPYQSASGTTAMLAAGTSGYLLQSNGASAPSWTTSGDTTSNIGYLNIPQNAQTGSYTLVLADSGKHIYHASGAGSATYTIPANASVAYPIGTALTFINLSSTAISIAITSDTMYLSSTGTTGTRTLAQYGSATAIKVTSTEWLISGSALT